MRQSTRHISFRLFMPALLCLAAFVLSPEIASAQNLGLDGGDAQPTRRSNSDDQKLEGTSRDGKIKVKRYRDIRMIWVEENDREIEIKQDKKGPVSVKVIRMYGADDMDVLARKSPQMAKVLQNMPAQIDGQFVEMTIRLVTSGSADSVELFAQNHPGLFNILKRYANKADSVELGSGTETLSAVQKRGYDNPNWGKRASDLNNLPTANVAGPGKNKFNEDDPDEDDPWLRKKDK